MHSSSNSYLHYVGMSTPSFFFMKLKSISNGAIVHKLQKDERWACPLTQIPKDYVTRKVASELKSPTCATTVIQTQNSCLTDRIESQTHLVTTSGVLRM